LPSLAKNEEDINDTKDIYTSQFGIIGFIVLILQIIFAIYIIFSFIGTQEVNYNVLLNKLNKSV